MSIMVRLHQKDLDCNDSDKLDAITHNLERYVLFAYGVTTNQQKPNHILF